jgi:hypothetical protein
MATTTGDRDAETGSGPGPGPDPGSDDDGLNRRLAALAVAPFLALGLADVVLLLGWGIEPLWAFAILPPILFCSVLAWIAFSTDFLVGRT